MTKNVFRLIVLIVILVIAFSSLNAYQVVIPDGSGAVEQRIQRDGEALVYIAVNAAGTTRAQRAASIASEQQTVLSTLAAGDFRLVHQYRNVPALTGYLSASGFSKLRNLTTLRGIELVVEIEPHLNNSRPLIGAQQVQTDLGFTGEGITVAVIDSGIDTDHPDLEQSVVAQQCFLSTGDCPGGGVNGSSAEDDQNHGSHVSGIITSDGTVTGGAKGIAPDADIIAVKVLRADNSFSSLNDVIAGIDWLVTENLDVDVINLSLGTNNVFTGVCDDVDSQFTDLKDAFDDVGAIVFASSGNAANNTSMAFPACLSNVYSVGSTYATNYGSVGGRPCTDSPAPVDGFSCFTNRNTLLDILAPGAFISSTVIGGGYASFPGTSMASPTVAGVAALMLEANPDLTGAEIISIMQTTGVTVNDPGAASGQPTSYKRVDALAAVEAALALVPTATATPDPTSTPDATSTSDGTTTPDATSTPDGTTTPGATSTPESSATPDATTTPGATATETPVADVQLVVNGGFEAEDTAGDAVLAPWQQKDAVSDKIKCNKLNRPGKPDKILAYAGDCAYAFKGSVGENSKIQQNADLTPLTFAVNDVLRLDVYVNASNPAAAGKVKLRVKYGDTTETGKITLTIGATTGYTPLGQSYALLSTNVTKIKLQVQNTSPAGKVYVDDVSLLYTQASTGLLPLP